MSTYYEFYLGKKTDNGKIKMVAPFKYSVEENKFKRVPLLSRSSSFIDFDEFDMCRLEVDKMADEDVDYFSWDGQSITYYMPYSNMVKLSKSCGLRQGYAPLEDFKAIALNNYIVNYEWEYNLIGADQYAESPVEVQKTYGKIAFTVVCSTDYLADRILSAASEVVLWDEEDYCFMCRVS